MQRHPNQNAEDIGARLLLPSSLSVLIRTTGVPKYRIGGSILVYIAVPLIIQFTRRRTLCCRLNEV